MHSYRFVQRVQQTWAHWLVRLDAFSELDCEETEQSFSIILPDKRIYLFNIHTSMQQLWMSSPVSGGHHFILQEEKNFSQDDNTHNALDSASFEHFHMMQKIQWINTRNHEKIEHILNAEFKQKYFIDLKLTPVYFAK